MGYYERKGKVRDMKKRKGKVEDIMRERGKYGIL